MGSESFVLSLQTAPCVDLTPSLESMLLSPLDAQSPYSGPPGRGPGGGGGGGATVKGDGKAKYRGVFLQSRFTTKDPGPKTLFVSLGQVWLIGGFWGRAVAPVAVSGRRTSALASRRACARIEERGRRGRWEPCEAHTKGQSPFKSPF